MNGKDLRRRHRAAMFQDGGLVRDQDSRGKRKVEKTQKYVPLRIWLRTQGDEQVAAAAKTWFTNKQQQKPRRRVVGLTDPHSPSRLRRSHQQVAARIARAEQLVAERKAAQQAS